MSINKNQLLEIKNLDLCDIIEGMNDYVYNEYCVKLKDFIEKFPLYETELKDLFKKNDLSGIEKSLSSLKETLSVIRSGELIKKCEKLSEDIKNSNREMAEASLTYFLTSVSMLSIEIQMAKHKSGNETPEGISIPQPDDESEEIQKNILAVDDVSLLLSTLRSALQNTKYNLTGVTSGEAALKYIKNHKVDLFLLDIEMPGMDGYELAAKLKENGQTTPIIFLTGNAQSKYVIKAMQMGAADFIVKPFNTNQVLEKIEKHIR